MNKQISILVLETDVSNITYFDLAFKGQVLNYRVVKNLMDFKMLLSSRQWDFVWIQHDMIKGNVNLSTDPESGYNALVFLIQEYPLKNNATVFLHTVNPQGAKNMLDYAYINNYNLIYCPIGGSQFKAEIVRIKKLIGMNPNQ